ncbi:MAG: DEAD/DEAH box helicase [Erysipelotrichaceae bacterium]|nr:DEAD/DEAH box helicase [Erysipelotrichaceae bacterium]
MKADLKDTTLKFIELNRFQELTKVQEEVLKYTSKGKDVIALSKTGTGKTHAYLIPVMEMINPQSDKTQVVISLPTRELAYQVFQNSKLMKEVFPDLRIQLLSGGTDKSKSIKKMDKAPHIVIGTPGRIKDLFVSNSLRVDFVQMFIIDEADMTLEFGFLEDIDVVFSHMVKNPELLCFSATFPEALNSFVKKYFSNPKIIRVEDKKRDPKISHVLVNCKHKSYIETMYDILPGFNPYVCLIFANSKDEADEAYAYLNERNIKALLIHGGLEARDRQKAIKDLQSKKYTYVIASDVASRGIDIDGISHVISMGLPQQLQFYMHRAGRTGRNEKDGICYLLYKETDIPDIRNLNKKGINFTAKEYKKGVWKEANNPTKKKEIKVDLNEKEIVKQLHRKKEKVKPNYKKKKNQEIEKIKRKKRREFIQSKIKEERKERYKKKQREKSDD